MKKQRVAIVRCDTHAYWYGVFMDECDPLVLATSTPDAPTREGVHHYFRAAGNPRQLAVRRVPGFVITKVYDRVGDREPNTTNPEELQYGTYPGRAIAFSETFLSRPKVCDTLEEAVKDVDAAYLADSSSPHDGADHLRLARPFLERGIPCFIDKPFASTLADAQKMVRLAQKHGTVLMNASILGHCDVGKQFQRRFSEIGKPGLLVVKGVGPGNAAVIHGVAAAQGLFGYGVESVECMGMLPLEQMLLYYPDGREAVVLNTPNRFFPRTCTFYISAYSNLGAIHSPGIGDGEFHTGTRRIVQLFRRMIETGKPPIPYEHMLEPIAIIEAARIAQKTGKRVALRDVYGASARKRR